MHWTKPYYGVTHCGYFSLRSYWCTVTDRNSFVELSKFYPGCGFHPHESTHETVEEAKNEAEKWLKANN